MYNHKEAYKILMHHSAFMSSRGYTLFSSWLKAVAEAVEIEAALGETISSVKPISKYLGNLPENYEDKILLWCNATYDVYHPLRNNVELLDSIEEVRVYRKKKESDEKSLGPGLLPWMGVVSCYRPRYS